MTTTQQRQQQAREQKRRQREWEQDRRFRQRWQNHMYNWSRVGLNDYLPDVYTNLNAMRHMRRRPILPLGNHWMVWNHRDNNYASYNWEQVRREHDVITQLRYRVDNMTFTPHSLEQLWSRSGASIGAYDYNLNIPCLTEYLNTLGGEAYLIAGQASVRRDIIVPFRSGAFLGCVIAKDTSFTVQLRPHMRLWQDQGSVEVGDRGKFFNRGFRAMTWISQHQLRSDQAEVSRLILADQPVRAAEVMLDLPSYHFEDVIDYSISLSHWHREAEQNLLTLEEYFR